VTTKWDFIECLSDNDVPVVDYDQDEITKELDAAEKFTVYRNKGPGRLMKSILKGE